MAKASLSNWKNRHKFARYWLVVGFGSGLLRPAPGTWGSLAGLLIGGWLLTLEHTLLLLISLSLVTTIVSVLAIDSIENQTGVHDAPEIVIDEFVGQWIALLPLTIFGLSLYGLITAFALFRLFDIIKPWPIGWLDKRVSGGFGVMVDDIVAGLLAALLLYTLIATGLL